MKKFISAILTFCIIISSFAVFADEYLPEYKYVDDLFRFDVGDFAQGTVSSDELVDVDAERINLLSVMGIWDDASKNKEALLTQTEFSVIMSNLKLGADNAIKSVYLIKDNEKSDKVTYLDAYTYLVETLGYSYRCAEFGNTGKAFLIVASDIGLVSAEPENINAFITRNELAKLIMKALEIDMCIMEYTERGGYRYKVSEGKTLLNSVHGIYDVSGFVNAIPGLSVYGGATLKDGFIQISRKNINASGLNCDKYFGRGVRAYATFDEDLNQYNLIYIDYSDEYEYLEFDFSNIGDITGDSVTYLENNDEKELYFGNLKYITENGDKLSSVTDMSDFKTNDGKIIFTASEKRGDIDTAIIYKYNYFVVEYNDLMKGHLGFKYHKEYDGNKYLQIDEKAYNSVIVNGKKATVEEIPAGSAVRIFRCKATGYTEIIASTEKVSGEVSLIYDDLIETGGKEYRIPNDLTSHINKLMSDNSISYDEKIHQLEIGRSYTFYLIGDVVAAYTRAQEFEFGYVKSVSTSRTSIDPELSIRIFTEEGEWKDYKVKEKLEVDGQNNITKDKLLETIRANSGTENDIINNICRYKVNLSEEIIALDTLYEDPLYEGETNDDIKYCDTFDSHMNWTYWSLASATGTAGKYFVNDKTVFFVIPEDVNKEKAYKVVANTELPTGEGNEINMDLYNPDDFMHIKAAVIHGELGIASSNGEVGLYVESIRKTIINAEDQIFGYRILGTQTVNGRAKGKGSLAEISYYVEEEEFDKKPIVVGDFISIKTRGTMLLEWETTLAEGEVPEVYANQAVTADTGDTFYKVSGTIEKIDAVEHLVLVEVNGDRYVYSPRSLGVIDKAAGKMMQVTISDFHVGDWIYLYGNLGNATYMIKNKK